MTKSSATTRGMSRRRFMAAGDTVVKTLLTRAATSAPDSGLISSFDFCAAATNSGSAIVAMKALRSASARSAGIPGGARTGRPSGWRARTSCNICFCSSVLA